MAGTIDLYPSADPNSLIDAIEDASQNDKTIKLHAGTYFTTPGRGITKMTKIGKNGLRMEGPHNIFPIRTNATIKRPDNTIDLLNPDTNFGLFFIPDDATEEDFSSVREWKGYSNESEPDFQYAVITRGVIEISNLVVDCNMGKQGLQALYNDQNQNDPAEHSCMFGFSGSVTVAKNGPFNGRKIFTTFERVIIKNIQIINGGYADDIWIPPGVSHGYCNPNIEEMHFLNISAGERIAPHRATISFSGLVGKLFIENANIAELHCEQTGGRWDQLPRKDDEYKDSYWELKKITANKFNLAPQGKNLYLNASDLLSKESFYLDNVGGLIQNSTFNKGSDPRLFRLNNAIFRNVSWVFVPNSQGVIAGIKPSALHGIECTAIFLSNNFNVSGDINNGGVLVDSEYSRTTPGNVVGLAFGDCTYDQRFGVKSNPQIYIFKARERGTWTIKKIDFGTRDENLCVLRNTEHTDVDINLV